MGRTIQSAREPTSRTQGKNQMKMVKSQAKIQTEDKIYGRTPIRSTIGNYYRQEPQINIDIPDYDYGLESEAPSSVSENTELRQYQTWENASRRIYEHPQVMKLMKDKNLGKTTTLSPFTIVQNNFMSLTSEMIKEQEA